MGIKAGRCGAGRISSLYPDLTKPSPINYVCFTFSLSAASKGEAFPTAGPIMYKQSWLQSQATWGATRREHRSASLPQGCPPELRCQAGGERSLHAGNTASWQETAVLGGLCLPVALVHDKVLSAGRVDRPFLHLGAGGGVGITTYPQPPEMFLAPWTCAGPLHFHSCCSAVKLNFVATLRAGDTKIQTFSAVSKLCAESKGFI